MHEELIDTLRLCESNTHRKECPYYNRNKQTEECKKLLARAADAMEQLEKDVARAKEWASFWEKEATEALKKFQVAVASKPRWISVAERLPEKRKYVLVRYKNNDMAVACWFDGDENILFWRAMTDEGWCADCDTEPTHWTPLPTPPQEENGND